MKFIHKYINHPDELPAVFSTYFNRNKMTHTHNTRSKDNLHMESFSSTLGQRSIIYKGPLLWNTLPDEMKGIRSVSLFADKLKEIFLNNIRDR